MADLLVTTLRVSTANLSTGLLYHDYSKLMHNIVKMIPKDVKVTCGLTQESIDSSDYGGFEPVDNAAIQGLYDMHKNEQGRHWTSSRNAPVVANSS
jgi:hypothetical protein